MTTIRLTKGKRERLGEQAWKGNESYKEERGGPFDIYIPSMRTSTDLALA